MTAARIAAALGAAHRSGSWWSCLCPAHDDRNPSLSIREGDRRLIVKCWAGCDLRDVLTALRRMGLLASCYDDPRRAPVTVHDDDAADTARSSTLARHIWGATTYARGTPVALYLAGRGITLPVPPALRWARSLRRRDGIYGPAMVARVGGFKGQLIGVHRTWLDRDHTGYWHRRDRASLGPIGGGAVRLAPAAGTLMIGEGIETALAAMQATAMPAWAALSTSGLVALALPPIVRNVIILADHDRSGAGERAARAAAQRWLAEGRRVRLALPPEPGTDMADILAGRAYSRVAEARDVAA